MLKAAKCQLKNKKILKQSLDAKSDKRLAKS